MKKFQLYLRYLKHIKVCALLKIKSNEPFVEPKESTLIAELSRLIGRISNAKD